MSAIRGHVATCVLSPSQVRGPSCLFGEFMITVSVSALKSLSGNSNQGVPTFSCYLTVSGLTQGSSNTFSATSNGASSGTPWLGRNANLMHTPEYIPTDASNIGAWMESALPSQDTSGNLQFSLKPAAGGPTSFRIGLIFAVN